MPSSPPPPDPFGSGSEIPSAVTEAENWKTRAADESALPQTRNVRSDTGKSGRHWEITGNFPQTTIPEGPGEFETFKDGKVNVNDVWPTADGRHLISSAFPTAVSRGTENSKASPSIFAFRMRSPSIKWRLHMVGYLTRRVCIALRDPPAGDFFVRNTRSAVRESFVPK